MCLEDHFKCPIAIEHYRNGPMGFLLDGFVQNLKEQMYSPGTIQRLISNVDHWNRFLDQNGVRNFKEITHKHISGFKEHLGHCKRRTNESVRAMNCYLRYLTVIGWKDQTLVKKEWAYQGIMDDYLEWLVNYRGVSKATQNTYLPVLRQFLNMMEAKGEELVNLTGDKVEKYYLDFVRPYGRARRRTIQTTLRSFFRFCKAEAHLTRDWSTAVPTLRSYRLVKIPRGIEAADGQKLITEIRTGNRLNYRSRAMMLLLYTYGVRGIQVRKLRFQDIDWERNRICFAARKNGREIIQPLTREVGESILLYLEKNRPPCACEEIFLTGQAPYRPMETGDLSRLVRFWFRVLDIQVPACGANAFRHGFASRMLAQGESLKTIADMLGHRHIQTTYQYTKIDFSMLGQVPLDWPEVAS